MGCVSSQHQNPAPTAARWRTNTVTRNPRKPMYSPTAHARSRPIHAFALLCARAQQRAQTHDGNMRDAWCFASLRSCAKENIFGCGRGWGLGTRCHGALCGVHMRHWRRWPGLCGAGMRVRWRLHFQCKKHDCVPLNFLPCTTAPHLCNLLTHSLTLSLTHSITSSLYTLH